MVLSGMLLRSISTFASGTGVKEKPMEKETADLKWKEELSHPQRSCVSTGSGSADHSLPNATAKETEDPDMLDYDFILSNNMQQQKQEALSSISQNIPPSPGSFSYQLPSPQVTHHSLSHRTTMPQLATLHYNSLCPYSVKSLLLQEAACQRSPNPNEGTAPGLGKGLPPTHVTTQAVEKLTPRVLTSRHTSEHTQERSLITVTGMDVAGSLPVLMSSHVTTGNTLVIVLFSVRNVTGHSHGQTTLLCI
ncbi:hypothetical protein MATL_G00068040 [Megalops atlanticus]|uniref:Uncharacterized protein n=1 Tax=Megalops atlanticus TaxID=7932 RepID=A0A9D3T9W8_MEGAT|nr:hypothetical protein MATL_G00068040 [Megalops atlanticus]